MDESGAPDHPTPWQYELVGCLVVTLPAFGTLAFAVFRLSRWGYGALCRWLRQAGRPSHGLTAVAYLVVGSIIAVVICFMMMCLVIPFLPKSLLFVGWVGDRLKSGLGAVGAGGGWRDRPGGPPPD